MLGILQAGGAYVPLDPAYPQERLTFMLEDSRAAVLLTQPGLAEIFVNVATPRLWLNDIMYFEPFWMAPLETVSPQQMAYLVYTSGSTGRPTGTMVSHHVVVNFFVSIRLQPGMVAQDHLLAATSFSFDIAVLELLLPLTLGARVQIASQQVLMDGRALAALLEMAGSTLMQAPPSTWKLLLGAGWRGRAALKILYGGEALSIELARQLQCCGSSLWNMYGPPETTI